MKSFFLLVPSTWKEAKPIENEVTSEEIFFSNLNGHSFFVLLNSHIMMLRVRKKIFWIFKIGLNP